MIKKRMLLFGPGYGHNVEAKLQSFEGTSLFDITFIAYQFDETFRQKYPYINYVPCQFDVKKKHPWHSLKSLWWLYKQVRCSGHYDVVYSLGMSHIMGALIFWMAKRKTKRAFEIWSIHVLDQAKRNSGFGEKLDAYVIKRADLICQYWWGIREKFVNLFPQYESKFLMYQLSYPEIFFTGERHEPESDFVKTFLTKIPQEQIVCFWPRSFIHSNNHPLFLESLGIVKRRHPELLSNFMLYLWGGNVQDEKHIQTIKTTISNNGLVNCVEMVEHPFVSQNDIFSIEERSDFFVQIANDDILSTYIMEMLCSGKPFILSNLRTFQFLNEKYDLKIDLVNNVASEIADSLEKILYNLSQAKSTYNYSRRDKCREFFSSVNTIPTPQLLYDAL